MDLQFLSEFDTYAASGQYEGALQEKDFVKRAMKLFEVREKLWKAADRSENAIDDAAYTKAQNRARWPGRIAFGVVAPLCLLWFLSGAPVITAAMLLVGAGIGATAGLCAGWAVRGLAKMGPRADAERELDAMEQKRKTMHARIETEIEAMDSQLISQSPQVRAEFREAFKHASVKEEARLNRIHRAKVEEEVEETREAAQTAAAMSSVAAANSAMASMRR